jgi:hypothetical protein
MDVESLWTVYRTRFLVRARQLTEPLLFTDPLGREHSGNPGDYLVESSLGFRSITPRAIFEDVYVPLRALAASDSMIQRASTQRPRSLNGSPPAIERQPSLPPPDPSFDSSPDRQVPSWSG